MIKKTIFMLFILLAVFGSVGCSNNSFTAKPEAVSSAVTVSNTPTVTERLSLEEKAAKIEKGMSLSEAINILNCEYYPLDMVSGENVTYYYFTDGVDEVYLDVNTESKLVLRIKFSPGEVEPDESQSPLPSPTQVSVLDGNLDEGLSYENFAKRYNDALMAHIDQSTVMGTYINYYLPSKVGSIENLSCQFQIPTGTIIVWFQVDNPDLLRAVEYANNAYYEYGTFEYAMDDFVDRSLLMAVFNIDLETASDFRGPAPNGGGSALGNIVALYYENEETRQATRNYGLLDELQSQEMPRTSANRSE